MGSHQLKVALFFRVLIFPPVNNYYRLLIHKTVEEEFPDLSSFSIGADEERRTVVCQELTLLRYTTKNTTCINILKNKIKIK